MGMIKELNCPITLLQGEFNSTTRADGPKQLMERDKEGVHKVIKGASHFLPMEFPEIIRNEIINMKLRIQDLKNK